MERISPVLIGIIEAVGVAGSVLVDYICLRGSTPDFLLVFTPLTFSSPKPTGSGVFCQGYALSLSSPKAVGLFTHSWGPVHEHQGVSTHQWACMPHVWGSDLLQVLCSLVWGHKVPSFHVSPHGGTA